jgi:hypothetical protein
LNRGLVHRCACPSSDGWSGAPAVTFRQTHRPPMKIQAPRTPMATNVMRLQNGESFG